MGEIIHRYKLPNGKTVFIEDLGNGKFASRTVAGITTEKYDKIKLKYVLMAKELLTRKRYFEILVGDRFEDKNKDYIMEIYNDFKQVRHCKNIQEVMKYSNWASHCIPNTFYKWNDRSLENIRCIQWMVFDFELRKSNGQAFIPAQVYEIFYQTVGFAPTIIKESKTKGSYHVFLKHTSINGSTESTHLFKRIQMKIAEIVGTDLGAIGANHAFSIPTKEQKIYYFGDNTIDFNDLKHWWYNLVAEENKKLKFNPKKKGKVTSFTEHMVWKHEAVLALMNHEYDGHRNEAGFTLALLFYAMSEDAEIANDFLKDKWYPGVSQAGKPYRWSELKASIKSAYSGKYHGPSKEKIEALTGIEFNLRIYKGQYVREQRHNQNENQQAIVNYFRERDYKVRTLKKDLIADICNTQESPLGKEFTARSIERNLDLLKKQGVIVWESKGKGGNTKDKTVEFELKDFIQKETETKTIIEEDYNTYVFGEVVN